MCCIFYHNIAGVFDFNLIIEEHFCVSNRHVQGVHLTLSKLGRGLRVPALNLTVCKFPIFIQVTNLTTLSEIFL